MEEAGEKICPICSSPLIFVEEKGRFWCYRCKVNPFYESELHDREAAVFMFCSKCDSVLKFIPQKKEFWCWTCNEYPMFYEKRVRTSPLPPDNDMYKRSEIICFTCGRYLRYIHSEKKHWCDSCRKFQKMYFLLEDDSTLAIKTDKASGVYTTMHHPEGLSAIPKYKIVGNEFIPYFGGPAHYEVRGNRVYSKTFSPEGRSSLPMYVIKGNRIYTTIHHEEGPSLFPWFIIK